MGRLVVQRVVEAGHLLVAAVTHADSPAIGVDAGVLAGVPACGVDLSPVGPGCFGNAEVVIDFSLPEAVRDALPFLDNKPLVSGTTGLGAGLISQVDAYAGTAPVLLASNFSTGIALLCVLIERAAAALEDYDVEVVETHHRNKLDAPSGTAFALAAAVSRTRGVRLEGIARHGRIGRTGVRPHGEIGFHAVRGGDVVGDHTLTMLGPGEQVSFGHVATSRAVFAAGAVRAAQWLHVRPPGRYQMRDVLGIT
jgi:4-hydroxy-tetrahydrodipicolinate reductase